MKSNALFIAVLVLFDGGAVVWAAWEFWSIRKTKAETARAASAISEEAPGHPEGEHGPNNG